MRLDDGRPGLERGKTFLFLGGRGFDEWRLGDSVYDMVVLGRQQLVMGLELTS